MAEIDPNGRQHMFTLIRRYGVIYGVILLATLVPLIILPMGCTPHCDQSFRFVVTIDAIVLLLSFGFVSVIEFRDLRKIPGGRKALSTIGIILSSYLAAPLTVALIGLGFFLIELAFQLLLFLVYSFIHVLKLA
jgi:hypothetical protein